MSVSRQFRRRCPIGSFALVSLFSLTSLHAAQAPGGRREFPGLKELRIQIRVMANSVDSKQRVILIPRVRDAAQRGLSESSVAVADNGPDVLTIELLTLSSQFHRGLGAKWEVCVDLRAELKPSASHLRPFEATVHRCASKSNTWTAGRTIAAATEDSIDQAIDELLQRLSGYSPTADRFGLVTPTAGDPIPADAGRLRTVTKGAMVTLTIPYILLSPEGYSMTSGKPIYGVDVMQDRGTYVVAGRSDWRLAGFPSLRELRVEKVTSRDQYAEIELRADVVVKVRFVPAKADLAPALSAVAFAGAASSPAVTQYARESLDQISGKVFTGPLDSVAQQQRRELLLLAWQTIGAAAISHDSFRNETYLTIDMGSSDVVFNDLRLNQAGRVAEALTRRMLTQLKQFGAPLASESGLAGVRLMIAILHKDFLSESAPDADNVSIYAPKAMIAKFAGAEITSQQFIDACVVIVNGNRVEVPLSR
jgi:hypothetical protein